MTPALLSTIAALLALSTVSLGAGSRRLVVDHAASHVDFAARATMHTVEGRIERWDLKLTLPEGAELPDTVVFTGDGATMTTDHRKRDAEMHQWMEHEQHPGVRFELRRFTGTPEARQVEGELTLHGVTVPLSFPIALAHDGDRLTASGTAVIDVRTFGLKPFRKFGVLTVSPEVTVTFSITGHLE